MVFFLLESDKDNKLFHFKKNKKLEQLLTKKLMSFDFSLKNICEIVRNFSLFRF